MGLLSVERIGETGVKLIGYPDDIQRAGLILDVIFENVENLRAMDEDLLVEQRKLEEDMEFYR